MQAWQSNERPASSREAPREGERHRRDDTANRQRHGRPSSAPAQAQNKPPTAALRQLDNSASGTRNEAPAVRMTKSEAWARMAAYEACWQVCLQAVASGRKEAECFLLDSCSLLKDAFGLGPLTLRIGSGPSEAAPTLQPHQVETPVVLEDDPDCAASSRMPSKESAAKETRESLRIEVGGGAGPLPRKL